MLLLLLSPPWALSPLAGLVPLPRAGPGAGLLLLLHLLVLLLGSPGSVLLLFVCVLVLGLVLALGFVLVLLVLLLLVLLVLLVLMLLSLLWLLLPLGGLATFPGPMSRSIDTLFPGTRSAPSPRVVMSGPEPVIVQSPLPPFPHLRD